jgi:hypothetical protein
MLRLVDRRQIWIQKSELASKLFSEDGARFKNLSQADQAGILQAAHNILNWIMRMPGASADKKTCFQPLIIKDGQVAESEGPNWECFNMTKVSG